MVAHILEHMHHSYVSTVRSPIAELFDVALTTLLFVLMELACVTMELAHSDYVLCIFFLSTLDFIVFLFGSEYIIYETNVACVSKNDCLVCATLHIPTFWCRSPGIIFTTCDIVSRDNVRPRGYSPSFSEGKEKALDWCNEESYECYPGRRK